MCTCVQTYLCFTLIRAAATCDPFSKTSMCLVTGFIPLRWSVGWVGSAPADRAAQCPADRAAQSAPPARLLGGCAAWTEHASTGETDGLLTQWVSARTFPAPACDARNPCHCAAIHTHVRPARPPISEHPITARNMASTCTLRTLFTYALAGRPRSNAINCELCEKMANKLAGHAEGG